MFSTLTVSRASRVITYHIYQTRLLNIKEWIDERSLKRFDALRSKQIVNIVDISLHNFINISQMRHHLSALVNNETRTSLIRKVLYALRRHYLYKFDLPVLLSNPRKMHIDQIAKLIARLVQMQQHKRFRICLSYLPYVLIPRYLYHIAVFHLLCVLFQLVHSFCHVLLSKLIIFV